jgi:hypothetical protein
MIQRPSTLIDLINERHMADAQAQTGTIGYEVLTSLDGRSFRQKVGGWTTRRPTR